MIRMIRGSGSPIGKAEMLASIREYWRGLCRSKGSEDSIDHAGHSITLVPEELERGWSCSLVEDGRARLFRVEVLGESSLEKLKSLLDCYFRDDDGAARAG